MPQSPRTSPLRAATATRRASSHRRPVVTLLTAAAFAMLVPATAQAANEPIVDTFASAFFISWRYELDGSRSLELLGSMIIWFLLTLSVTSVGLIGALLLSNQRAAIAPKRVMKELRRLMEQGRHRDAAELSARDRSYFGRILNAGLREAPSGMGAVLRRCDEEAEERAIRLLRRVEYLNVIGQLSPLIGLFGTVYGMILAFRAIVVAGGNADPVLLAAGIGTALVTTFWGLVIAIPALGGYALLRNRIDELTSEATMEAESMLELLRRHGDGHGSGAPPGAGARGGPRHSDEV